MKRLGLLRHAKSDWDDEGVRDFDRGLNDRGRRGAALMGGHIAEYGADHGIGWDVILASPAARVRATLEASGLGAPIRWDAAAYLADSNELIALLHRLEDDPASVLIVGHNPGMQELVLDLAGEGDPLFDDIAEKYPTASFAVLELDIDTWRKCAHGRGRVAHFARPRDLDPELGPEKVS